MLITRICILKSLPVFSFPTFLPWGTVFYLGSSLLPCCGSFFTQLPSKRNSPHPQTSLSLPSVQYATKVRMVKAMVFPLVMYGCESWTIKKAEHRRTDAFELWCWRRLLRVPWTARRSNQSIQKKISPKYSLEGLILKLKLQYFRHLMRRTDSLEKTLMLGKIEGGRRGGCQRMRWLDGIADWMAMSLSKHQELVMHREACHSAVHGVHKESNTTEQLN